MMVNQEDGRKRSKPWAKYNQLGSVNYILYTLLLLMLLYMLEINEFVLGFLQSILERLSQNEIRRKIHIDSV